MVCRWMDEHFKSLIHGDAIHSAFSSPFTCCATSLLQFIVALLFVVCMLKTFSGMFLPQGLQTLQDSARACHR